MCESRGWHQYFCCKNVPVQWVSCSGWSFLHLLSQCKADSGWFLLHFCKICLWLWIVDTCLMKKLSLERSWSHICVGTILWLLTALTYSVWYDKLHWFIPDKSMLWFPGYCITTEGKWIPHSISGCVCATVMSLTAVWSQPFGACSGCSAGHLFWVSRTELSALHLCGWVRTCLCVRMEKLGGNGLGWPTTHPSWLIGSTSPASILLFISVHIRNNYSSVRRWRWE